MPTFFQLIDLPRIRKHHKVRPTVLQGCPQKKGVVLKVLLLSPKKPNSAVRKAAKIKLVNGKKLRAGIPGHGHNLQQFSNVLVCGGRVKDVPGISYKLIRGKFDLSSTQKIERRKGRSRWGLPKLRLK